MYDPTVMTTPRPFSATFRELREQLDWTQLQVAVFLGVTPPQVSRWETEASTPRPLTQDGILAKLRAEVKKAARKPHGG